MGLRFPGGCETVISPPAPTRQSASTISVPASHRPLATALSSRPPPPPTGSSPLALTPYVESESPPAPRHPKERARSCWPLRRRAWIGSPADSPVTPLAEHHLRRRQRSAHSDWKGCRRSPVWVSERAAAFQCGGARSKEGRRGNANAVNETGSVGRLKTNRKVL
jgi:hypothetical protein